MERQKTANLGEGKMDRQKTTNLDDGNAAYRGGGTDTCTIKSSAQAVRQHLATLETSDSDHKPLRNVEPTTGALEIYASTEALMQWVPKFGWDKLAHWCKLPIFRIRLFRNHEAFRMGGLERCYTEHVFPEGEDLVSALVWWRKRIREQNKGFAVFEAGFDTNGLVYLTDPPRCAIDAETGEVVADNVEELERKKAFHLKRTGMDQRWATKGVSDHLRNKIEIAEMGIQERRRRGEEYALRGGWVKSSTFAKPQLSLAGADIGGSTPRARGGGYHAQTVGCVMDVAKHNDYQKRFGLRHTQK